MLETKNSAKTRVLIIGAFCDSLGLYNSTPETMEEMRRLTETAGGIMAAALTQRRSSPDAATYIGEGKLEEAKRLAADSEVDTVIFDGELSPAQLRNIEKRLELPVIDRSMLILDIFAMRAASGEGKLQVELAQLKYTMPRLLGQGTAMSRLGAGIGTRGPGESKLESDRRHIRRRINYLQNELESIKKNRIQTRKARERSGLPKIAVTGYTNAGKSTFLNTLTGAGVLAEDKLFATLDPVTRRISLPNGTDALLTDTVGLIRNLPINLTEAFSSTLEEICGADLIIHLIDATDPDFPDYIEVVEKLTADLMKKEYGDKPGDIPPTVRVFNKCDLLPEGFLPRAEGRICVSAKTGEGIAELLDVAGVMLSERMQKMELLLPYGASGELEAIHQRAVVDSVRHESDGIRISLSARKELAGRLEKYRLP